MADAEISNATNATEATASASLANVPITTNQGAENSQSLTLADPAAEEKQSPMSSPWFLVLIVGVWMLFLWISRRNSKKREQKRQEELDSVKRGEHVVTIGRVHGVVVSSTEKTFTIRPDANKEFTLTFDREALLRVEKDDDKNNDGDTKK